MLLDTNSLLWVLTDASRLGPLSRQALAAETVYSSPISVVELRIKSVLGRVTVPDDLVDVIRAAGIVELPFLDQHADALREFPQLDRHDPFDRMLLAQASTARVILLTADRVLLDAAPTLTRDATR